MHTCTNNLTCAHTYRTNSTKPQQNTELEMAPAFFIFIRLWKEK
jgi:hypothetical protein